jgi:hypothetical protein
VSTCPNVHGSSELEAGRCGARASPAAAAFAATLAALLVGRPLREEGVGLLLGVEACPRLLAGEDVPVHGVRAAALPLDRSRPARAALPFRRLRHLTALLGCSRLTRFGRRGGRRAAGHLRRWRVHLAATLGAAGRSNERV